MTEDETFAALKKATFEQMEDGFVRLRIIYASQDIVNYDEWHIERKKFAENHGWTIKEYQQGLFERLRQYD